jgi:hypothetical protein
MKSAALAPVNATPLIEIETEPPFANVTDFDPPTLPSATLAQARLDGLTVAALRNLDPQTRHRTRSIAKNNDLRIFGFLFETFADEAAGARNNCAVRHFMGGSFLRKNER